MWQLTCHAHVESNDGRNPSSWWAIVHRDHPTGYFWKLEDAGEGRHHIVLAEPPDGCANIRQFNGWKLGCHMHPPSNDTRNGHSFWVMVHEGPGANGVTWQLEDAGSGCHEIVFAEPESGSSHLRQFNGWRLCCHAHVESGDFRNLVSHRAILHDDSYPHGRTWRLVYIGNGLHRIVFAEPEHGDHSLQALNQYTIRSDDLLQQVSKLRAENEKLKCELETVSEERCREKRTLQDHVALLEKQCGDQQTDDQLVRQQELQIARLEERCNEKERMLTSLRGDLNDQVMRLFESFNNALTSSSPRPQTNETSVALPADGVDSDWLRIEENSLQDEVSLHSGDGSVQSLPAVLAPRQCFLPGTRLITDEGPVAVEDLKPLMNLLTLQEDLLVQVTQVIKYKPAIERDLVNVELESGCFQVTSDHFVPVAVGPSQVQIEAGELKEGMMLLTASGLAEVRNIEKKNCETTEVVEVHLQDHGAVIRVELAEEFAMVYGAVPCKVQFRVNYLAGRLDALKDNSCGARKTASEPCSTQATTALFLGEDSFPLSRGSNGHPKCRGACALYKRGLCKFGAHCDACHVLSCKRRRPTLGKNQRERAKKKSP